ncbi:LRR receptor-like serine/threonine-protein kinase ERECTA [Bienertia sinuspersici]
MITMMIYIWVLVVVIVQCSIQSSLAIIDPLDFLALQSLHKSLRDVPGSNFFQSWDFTSDPCNFPGVYCNSDRVIALNLGDPRAGSPGLTGRIDPAIGKLSSLSEFTIVPGRVMGQIPDTISQLTNLRFFAVSRNFLTGSIPAGFGVLRNLRTLDLSYNQLSGPIPRPLGSLPVLSNLILCHNHLTGSLPPFSSTSLTRVDLMHNNLTGMLHPDNFNPNIQYLSLGWNRLLGPVYTLLPKLDRLNYLDLSMNQFSGLVPSQIFSFPLSNLQLQRNHFFGSIVPADEVKISTVDLSYNRLSGQVSPLLSTVQNLFLNNNRFMGSIPRSYVDRLMDGTIQTLYLQHNYLTGFQINPTAEIPLSSVVCLQYNCMVPPAQSACPLKAGNEKTRPTAQCSEWRG